MSYASRKRIIHRENATEAKPPFTQIYICNQPIIRENFDADDWGGKKRKPEYDDSTSQQN